MLDVVDAIRNLLEPVAGGAVTIDDTGEAPFTHAPSTLYAWPLRDARRVEGTGWEDRHEFTVRIRYVADSEDEEAKLRRLRSVSVALDSKAEAYVALIRTNRTLLGGHLEVSAIDWERPRTIQVRGFDMDITGWRIEG